VIDDPTYQNQVMALRQHLLQWALFDRTSPAHVDPRAPLTECLNAPPRGDGHREQEAYYRQRMSEQHDVSI
jgi:hypothetical protein